MTKATQTPTAKPTAPAYRVTVKQNGFRRCGRAWSGTTDVTKDELDEDQLAALQADAMFHVETL